jgi:hypothetical protein
LTVSVFDLAGTSKTISELQKFITEIGVSRAPLPSEKVSQHRRIMQEYYVFRPITLRIAVTPVLWIVLIYVASLPLIIGTDVSKPGYIYTIKNKIIEISNIIYYDIGQSDTMLALIALLIVVRNEISIIWL